MKKNNWFFVSFSFAILSALTAGCASAPKLVGPPVVRGSTNYTVAQPPVQLNVANEGRQWNRFVRDYNAERLEHNLRLQAIEDRAVEQGRAKERGVTLQPPAPSQPQAAAPVQQQSATYGVLPNGAPVLLPSQSLVPVVPQQQYYPYQERPVYGTFPNGAPVLLPSGGGGFGGGFGGYGNGFGSVPITPGTYRSSVRADWGPVRSGPLGKAFRFLTKGEDFPGYRHTGGPVVITRTYNAGGQVVAGGGFTSGLAVGWGR